MHCHIARIEKKGSYKITRSIYVYVIDFGASLAQKALLDVKVIY